jgi:glutathione S-transferase
MTKRFRYRLHGHAVSNFFNIVHAALIEKKVDFEIVTERASQDPEFLKKSPMGKIPFLETSQGCIAETVAILEYLEDAVDEPKLHPGDIFERARVRQIINVLQLYVEAPVRALYPGVFMGGSNNEATLIASKAALSRGSCALGLLVTPWEFLIGRKLTYADLFAFYCLDIAERVSVFVYGESVLDSVEGLRDWSARMAKRDSSRVVVANFERAFPGYLAEKNAAYVPPIRREERLAAN